jgi:nucleotide-binding universal stress UspA family protein
MTASIVCGVDHSPHAREAAGVAAFLARRLLLRLIVVHAVPATVPPVIPAWPSRGRDDRGNLREPAVASGERLLTDVLQRVDVPDAIGRIEEGLAPEALCRAAEEHSAAFVVIGTHGDDAAHAAVVGSVSLAVTRMATCPIVVVPPDVTPAPLVSSQVESIVCGVGHEKDVRPVRVAARLARQLDLALLPVHVVPSQDDGRSSATVAGIRSLLTDGRTAIRVGEPAQQLVQFAEEAHAAMVVVGTRGRGAVRSALFGSVSRDVARRSTTPVVVCSEPI